MSDYQVVNVGSPDQWRDYFGGFAPDRSRNGRRVVDREMKNQFIGLTVNALEPGEDFEFLSSLFKYTPWGIRFTQHLY